MWLARRADFDPEVLKNRYFGELRSLLTGRVEEHDLTLRLWLEMIAESRNTR